MAFQSINYFPSNKSKATDYTGFEDIKSTASAIGLALRQLNLLTPTGGLIPFAGDTAPAGFLLCDGSAVNRNIYTELFTVIGTKYGIGDGSTTFNLPDLRGRVIAGYNNSLSYYNTVGKTGGNNTHAITVSELPSHNHTGTTLNNGNHQHSGTTTNNGDHQHSGTTSNNGDHQHNGTTSTNGSHTHSSNAVGGQGNYGLALADGSNTVIDTDSSGGELNVWTVPGTLNINANGDHNHTYTTSVNGDHNHTFTCNNTGGGNSIELLQPYLVMNYIIKI
jgi:microcystin-dependent protein